MTDTAYDDYRRLMNEARAALTAAKEASDRGDTAAFQRCLDQSIQLTEKAKELMEQRRKTRP